MQSAETLEELQEKLNTYNEQLAQVSALLEQDAENTDFMRLKTDLSDVIKLTNDLIKIQESSAAPPIVHTFQPADTPLVIGTRIEALQNEHWHPALIHDVLDDGEQFIVKFYSNPDELETIHSALVKVLHHINPQSVDANQIQVGSQWSGRWSVDGGVYNLVVRDINTMGYKVVFEGYENDVETIPPEYVYPRTSKPQQQQQRKRAANDDTNTSSTTGADASSLKELIIPENLKILPTDTEKEKERKRKKIKALKNKHRIKGQEEERAEKQSDWQHFVAKGKNRRTGFITTKRKESIFASPDTVDGRVGVTGSGHGMTDFERRKKHKTTVQLSK